MPNMIYVLVLTSRRDFLQNSLKQDLNPGEGASPDSFFPLFRTCRRRINRRGNGKVCFMKTKTSLIRNSTSWPSRFNTMKLRRHTDLRAALIRIWLTVGITACLAAPAAKAAGTISATPNPVVYVTKPKPTPFLLGKQGETTITWDAGAANPYADVWVSVDGGAETLFSSAHKGSKATTIGFGKTHTFKLYSSSKVYLGASVSVTTKYYPFTRILNAIRTVPSRKSDSTLKKGRCPSCR
jgi:hypothetical protein